MRLLSTQPQQARAAQQAPACPHAGAVPRAQARASPSCAASAARQSSMGDVLQRTIAPCLLALGVAAQALVMPAGVLAESLATQDALQAAQAETQAETEAPGPAAVAAPQAGTTPEVAAAIQDAAVLQDSPASGEPAAAAAQAADAAAPVAAADGPAADAVIKVDAPAAAAPQRVSLELEVNGEPAGRVVVRTFAEPPLGSRRFLDLARRQAGGYRLSRVDGISDAFVTLTGVLQLNYPGMPEVTGGETVEELEAEQQVYPRSHDRAGLVSLVVLDALPKDVRERVVAYQGKLVTVQEVRGAGNANGTGLALTLAPAPELDRTNLVVGEVVEGLDVLQRIAQLPKVKSSSGSPFFKVAKALGDRRADVAARSFGKPLGKVVVRSVSVAAD